MAEETDPKELFKKLAEVLEKGGKTLEDRLKEYQTIKNKEATSSKEQVELTKQLNLRKNNLEKKVLEDQKRYADEQKRLVRAREITEKEASENIKNFNKSISDQIDDSELKGRIEKFGDKLEKSSASVSRFESFIGEGGERFKKDLLNVGSTIGNAAFNIAKSYRDSSSQVGFATTILQEGAGAAGSLLSTAGESGKQAGQALSQMGGRAKIAGAGLQVLGTVASLAGTGLSALASKVIPVLGTELGKNVAAFQSMSSSGALFSNGLTGMIETAGKAGMTLDTFNNVVKNNSSTLAGLGEGVSAGAARAANALNAGGVGMRKSLLNLGFSIEEQGSLVAETMRDMRQAGGPLTATDSQIAQQTQKYAENLRVIAGITGEDAKKKMDEARQASQELAFQQKLQGKSAEEQANILAAMGNMNKIERQAFQEMVTFGQVITPSLAATVSQSGALQEKLNATVGQYQQGILAAESFQNLGKEYNENIKKDALAATGIAQAGMAGVGGIVGDIKNNLSTVFQDVIKQTPEAIAAAQKAAKDQSKTQDEMTDSMNKVITAQNDAALAIQNAILKSGVMTLFADQTAKATKALTDMINKFTGESSGSDADEKEKNAASGEAIGGVAGAVIGGAIGAALGPAGAVIGSMVGEKLGSMAGGAIGRSTTISEERRNQLTDLTGGSTISGFARGGIIDGPKSGTLAMLHGKEIVLPLPDNLTPAKIGDLLSGLTEMQRQMAVEQIATGTTVSSESAFVQAMAMDQMKKFTSPDDSVPVLTRLSDQMEELLTATRLVVANTERTARGVA